MIRVLFENENFVVCDKPAEVLSVPARELNDPRPCLGLELKARYQKDVFPVHRLDYEVSGLILFALNAKAHQVSQDWFLNKTITKKYRASTAHQSFSHWPEGVKTDRTPIVAQVGLELFWRTQIVRGKRRSFEAAHGEWAETKAIICAVNEKELEWDLYPLTGKPHQLRFELARHGFPIHGDKLYGSQVQNTEAGIKLRAVQLDLSQVKDRLGLPLMINLD